jgi:predicted permease
MWDIFLWSFNAVAPILLILLVGWFVAFCGHIDEKDQSFLNRLCFRYLIPLQLLGNTLSIDFAAKYDLRFVMYCVIGIVATAAIAWIVFTFLVADRQRRAIFILSAFRTNNLILGLPLAANLYGPEGVTVAVMVFPASIIVFNFLAVVVLVYFSQDSDKKMKEILKKTLLDVARNPLILACLAGTICAALQIHFPKFMQSGISSAGSAGTTMALLLLGSQIDLKQLTGNIKPVLIICVLRLILIPCIGVTAMVLAGFRGPELSALMVIFAAPAGVSSMVMARNYNVAPVFAAQTVYLSTILSTATIFFIIIILRGLGLM